MSLTVETAHNMTLDELSNLSAGDLLSLQMQAKAYLDRTKSLKEWIDGAVALKYEQRAKLMRQDLGKDTGSVNFEDEGIRITADLPKRPAWDQKKLAVIADRIREAGDDPSEFIEIAYKVAERKYTAWPKALQETFADARTLKTGKPTFKLQNLADDMDEVAA